MKTSDLIFEATRAFLRVLEDALAGDKRAQERVKDILPVETYTVLIQRRQDDLDRQKFGPRRAPGFGTDK